jgi:hypothetical protein
MDIQTIVAAASEADLRTVVSRLLTAFSRPAFGSLPKREADILIFEAMRDLGVISKEASVYELMTDLRVTRAKAQQLLFDSGMRSPDTNPALLNSSVINAICNSRYAKDNNYFVLEIENPLVQAHLKEIIRRTGHISDSSFNSAIVRLSEDAFRDAILVLIPDDRREDVRTALVAAGAKDTSLKGVLKSVVEAGARISFGAGAEAIAGSMAENLYTLFTGAVGRVTEVWTGKLDDPVLADQQITGPQ